MDFNRYFGNQELEGLLKKWAAKHPDIFELESIGLSYENRSIWSATLTNRKRGLHSEKPAIYLDGNLHSAEVAGTTTVLYIIDKLLRGYGRDERLTRLLDECTIYAVPRVNPDGAELALSESPRFLRSGVRPYPFDDLDDGIHPEDIDGDGRILQMRIPDPNGDWKISKLDKRLMQKREPDENEGQFYRLLPEGMLENYDGYIVKLARPLRGLDFNRNFPFEWRPEAEQFGAGPYPTSEVEVRALVEYITRRKNINFGITYHTYSGVILRPFGTRDDDKIETDDLWVWKKIGERGTSLTGYKCVSVYHDFRYHPKEVITGTFDDWLYDHFGVFAFTVELWGLIEQAGITDHKFIDWYRDHPHEHDLQILEWIDKNGEHDSYVNWRKFKHPQLGNVEIGGWNYMYTWRNPPRKFMEREAARNAPFVFALGEMLPHLEVLALECEKVGRDTFKITLVVENAGFLPTYTSSQGRKRNAVRPVRAELKLPAKAVLKSGNKRCELGHLEGRSNKVSGMFAVHSSAPTDNRAKVEWVVRAPAGSALEVQVTSERAGVIKRRVKLKE